MLPVVPPVVNIMRITKQASIKVMRNSGRKIFDNLTIFDNISLLNRKS